MLNSLSGFLIRDRPGDSRLAVPRDPGADEAASPVLVCVSHSSSVRVVSLSPVAELRPHRLRVRAAVETGVSALFTDHNRKCVACGERAGVWPTDDDGIATCPTCGAPLSPGLSRSRCRRTGSRPRTGHPRG
jgi:hypothetical protein